MVMAKVNLLAVVVVLALIGWPGAPVRADDASGNYILRGVGAHACQDFINAEQTGADAVRPYVNWMEGYISGINRFQEETFDAAPVISSSNVGALARNLCRLEPEIRFETAVARLMQFFQPYRITQQSQLIELTVGDTSAAVRQQTLQWMQQKMADEGIFTGEANGLFGSDTRAALSAYQQARELNITGVPDAATIMMFIQDDMQPPE